jgi:imidazoleglycerol phosphate dehydratase HisB
MVENEWRISLGTLSSLSVIESIALLLGKIVHESLHEEEDIDRLGKSLYEMVCIVAGCGYKSMDMY